MVKRTKIYLGTELKLNISIEPVDGLTMDDYEFQIEAYCTPRKTIVVQKSEAIKVDSTNYIILVDTSVVGQGDLKLKVTAHIPDGDFNDQLRTEVMVVDTGLTIIKAT